MTDSHYSKLCFKDHMYPCFRCRNYVGSSPAGAAILPDEMYGSTPLYTHTSFPVCICQWLNSYSLIPAQQQVNYRSEMRKEQISSRNIYRYLEILMTTKLDWPQTPEATAPFWKLAQAGRQQTNSVGSSSVVPYIGPITPSATTYFHWEHEQFWSTVVTHFSLCVLICI